MSDYVTPCADPANNAEDWFIEKDGRQYADEPVLTKEEIEAAIEASDYPEDPDAWQDAVHAATEAKLAENLLLRRHAKDKCHVECYLRTKCLGVALAIPSPAAHGTWGGYYPEELRKIRELRDARQRERAAASHDADVPDSE